MKIRDEMVHDVVKIDPSASLAEAAQLMREANVGMLSRSSTTARCAA